MPPDGEPAGLDGLRQALVGWFQADGDGAWIGLQRHRERAEEAVGLLGEAASSLGDASVLELAAFSLAGAAHRLGEITGRGAAGPIGAEVIDRIFARFCIGK